MRLNKFIATAGICSRRAADELIRQGKIKINGEKVTELATEVDESFDKVEYEGEIISLVTKKYYIVLNKPEGYITSAKDQFDRDSVMDLVSDINTRIYPVGRLDYNTSGLLIMTNDGDFANIVTHPKNNVYKTYIARINGTLKESELNKLRRGVKLNDGLTAPAKVEVLTLFNNKESEIQISIHEGKNRQVRRMFEAIGFRVLKLKRIAVGSVILGNLPEGRWRHMTSYEIESLRKIK